MKRTYKQFVWLAVAIVIATATPIAVFAQEGQFRVEEASISDIQNAIRAGKTTCEQVVQAYLERAKAYNGVCTALLTKDGAPIPPATGMVRAGAPLKYPTQTVPISSVFPGYDQYIGTPLEIGRMETSISDPAVQLQYGLRVGIPDAGQLDALETLNIRGERSITCKGDFDRAPSAGPLPPGAPAVCEEFRKQPDALERAAELDKQYGSNPDLAKLPMYCVAFSLKNWYDAKDIRGTGGNDVNFAMDVPKYDSPDVAELRSKGAIIYAVATASPVGGASGQGPNSKFLPMSGDNDTDLQYGLWGGQTCNPYDTARVARGTSNGSGVSVSANLVTCAICEQTSASCKGPASRTGIALVLTTKGILGDGGIMSKQAGDRTGLYCKTLPEAVQVLDAVKGFKTEDAFSAVPKGIIPAQPYSSFLVPNSAVSNKPLKGVRIGVVREFMIKPTKNDVAISDQIDKEIKTVLRDKLGAELVESVDPLYKDDPDVPNMKYTFQDALSEIMPMYAPEFFWRADKDGKLIYAVPGWDVRTIDYYVALSMHKAPLSPKLNIRNIAATGGFQNAASLIQVNKYLAERGDARVKDWASWVANAHFDTDQAMLNAQAAVGKTDPRQDPERASYIKMQAVMRMVILKVMQENKIDVFVNPEQTVPPPLLGGAIDPDVNDRPARSCCQSFTAVLGAPEVDLPAGFVTTVYNPKTVLSADKKSYTFAAGDVESKLPHPMPISMMFWAGPGSDPDVIKVASAYESATHYRKQPPQFGPVPSKSAMKKP